MPSLPSCAPFDAWAVGSHPAMHAAVAQSSLPLPSGRSLVAPRCKIVPLGGRAMHVGSRKGLPLAGNCASRRAGLQARIISCSAAPGGQPPRAGPNEVVSGPPASLPSPRRLHSPPPPAACLPSSWLHSCLPLPRCSPSTTPPRAPRPAAPQAQLAAIPQRVKPQAPGGEDVAQAAVTAAQGLDVKLAELRRAAKRAYDRVYYGDVLPPIGSFQISYARSAPRAAGSAAHADMRRGTGQRAARGGRPVRQRVRRCLQRVTGTPATRAAARCCGASPPTPLPALPASASPPAGCSS